MKFELLIDASSQLAETPIWDERIKKLYWTELFTGDVHQYDPQSKKEKVWATGKPIGSAIPCDDETKLFCALDGGLYLLDLINGDLRFIAHPETRPEYKYNDTRIDAAGRIFTSSVSKLYATDGYKPDMVGSFFMVDTDGSVKIIADHVNQYNAIVWNRDNTVMYVVDTYNQKLLAFPYDIKKGPVGRPKTALDLSAIGMPDGISIDIEGTLYICHWTKKISIWSHELALKEIIEFPEEYVCCGGFGGEDMKDFFVTTSKFNYTSADLLKNPGAGGIFSARSPVAGRPDHFYKIK